MGTSGRNEGWERGDKGRGGGEVGRWWGEQKKKACAGGNKMG